VSGFSFDSNIIIDALSGYVLARTEIDRATEYNSRAWISRAVWMEVMSKGEGEGLKRAETLLSGFGIDELDVEIASRAAALRRERPQLKAMDAIILATAPCYTKYKGFSGRDAGHPRSLYSLTKAETHVRHYRHRRQGRSGGPAGRWPAADGVSRL
jgi:predicted nucleic acid-binding protein